MRAFRSHHPLSECCDQAQDVVMVLAFVHVDFQIQFAVCFRCGWLLVGHVIVRVRNRSFRVGYQ